MEKDIENSTRLAQFTNKYLANTMLIVLKMLLTYFIDESVFLLKPGHIPQNKTFIVLFLTWQGFGEIGSFIPPIQGEQSKKHME